MYKMIREFQTFTGERAWNYVMDHLKKTCSPFYSVTGGAYEVISVTSSEIVFRNNKKETCRGKEKGEIIKKDNFVAAYNFIKNIEFNTVTVKEKNDRQQSPFIGLLISAKMIG
mgnify:CR=1 FL=1